MTSGSENVNSGYKVMGYTVENVTLPKSADGNQYAIRQTTLQKSRFSEATYSVYTLHK